MNRATKAANFLALHHQMHDGTGILVLANVWDAVSARIVAAEGFPALATSSAGCAAVFGYPDGERIPPAEMNFLLGRIVSAVAIPVSADLEAGYEDPAETARAAMGAGAVGLNLEDMRGNELLALPDQLARIRAVKAAAAAIGGGLVLNARTDIFLAEQGDSGTRFSRAVERLNAYREAGADCLFAPGVKDRQTIGRLVRAIDGPLNILAAPGCPAVAELEDLGVARVSLGSGPSRVALGALRRFARDLRTEGTFEALESDAIPYADVQRLLS